jgi:hypothetical protein
MEEQRAAQLERWQPDRPCGHDGCTGAMRHTADVYDPVRASVYECIVCHAVTSEPQVGAALLCAIVAFVAQLENERTE